MTAQHDKDPMPLVSIIAVNYNGAHLVDRFMGTVGASHYRPVELLLIDNSSEDDSARMFERWPQARVIRSDENVGFGRACNIGVQQANGELLMIMNPDVVLDPQAIEVMVSDMLGNPGAAVVCATLIGAGGEHDRQARVEDVASMAAAAMLIDRAHFQRLGGFDPWIFLYSEDTDFCYRTWLAGRRVLKAWDAVAEHEPGGTGGGARWSAEQIKNGLYVHIKLRSWPATVRYAGRMAVKTVVRGVRLRDPSVLGAWWVNVRQLPETLGKRRMLLGAASPEDRSTLERLAAEHDYWARRAWRQSVLRRLRRTGKAPEH